MLGLYVSDHPLLGVEASLRRKVDCMVADAMERDDGSMVTLGGVITGLTRKYTKKGDQMAVFVLEDLAGAIEVTVFPRVLQDQGHRLANDSIVLVRGRIDRKDESRLGFMAQEVTVADNLHESTNQPLHLRIPAAALSELKIHQLRRILRDHPGDSAVFLHLGSAGETGKVLRLADEFCVNVDRVVPELRVAFGHSAIKTS
jgi:DNA polymerase-3 subunit alpha